MLAYAVHWRYTTFGAVRDSNLKFAHFHEPPMKLPTASLEKIIHPPQLRFTSERALIILCVREWGNLTKCEGSTRAQPLHWSVT